LTWHDLGSPRPPWGEHGASRRASLGERYVALLLALFAVAAAFYGFSVALGRLPFNAGGWVVGEELALRGWLAYLLAALLHLAAAVGLWRHVSWARWLSIFLLVVGLLPAVPGISAAVVDLRVAGIALWGALIILRSAALYVLLRTE